MSSNDINLVLNVVKCFNMLPILAILWTSSITASVYGILSLSLYNIGLRPATCKRIQSLFKVISIPVDILTCLKLI